ncbi:mechanosensitive ion channel [Bacillus sp. SD088]|uniref:mechanosensitive ion channel n=1 Tax=Bacillus sp. SD088 TaxID=2782012 RepID=UPI001A97C53B|nr:mechanosensitive ion channel [Bacillus sp. SD088]MBO0991879.1 mechanosensitive ion channel [Bacillus sp. SD088]
MNIFDMYATSGFLHSVQNFVVAILVLLVGWLIAKIIAGGVEKALKKTKLDEKLYRKVRPGEPPVDSNKIIGKIIYYILLVFVLILFFNVLNLNMIANPLTDLISTFLAFIPAVLKAVLILALAFVIGALLQWAIVHGSKKIHVNHLLVKIKLANTIEKADEYLATIGKVAFYLILLIFIPGVMDALNIQGVSEPFSGLLATILAFIPKLIAAAIIFAVGWFLARIVKNIVVNLLQAVGSEKLVSKLKMGKIFGDAGLATFIGNLVFILILIPVTITALEKLDLTGITEPAISMLHEVMNMIPNILIAIALVFVGIWLGKFIGGFVSDFLSRTGFDNMTAKLQMGQTKADTTKMQASTVVGYIVQVLIIFFLTIQALYLIKLDFLVGIAAAITAYLPNVLAAVLILGVALILANIVEKVLINLLHGPAIKILAGFAKYAIIALSVFMALTQLGIATSIVASAFTLILGALALAFGLAFGLGGKEFASKYLRKFDETIEETKVKNDNEIE